MLNPGKVFSHAEIEERLYDESGSRMSNVIDSTVYHLRNKLEPDGNEIISTRRGQGYLFPETLRMKSIRRRISAWMLPGLASVRVLGGFAVYRTYHSALLSAIDSENMSAARLVRAEQRSQGRGGGPDWGRANRDPEPSLESLFYQA